MFKLMDKKIIAILRKVFCLSGPMLPSSFFMIKLYCYKVENRIKLINTPVLHRLFVIKLFCLFQVHIKVTFANSVDPYQSAFEEAD